jgi:RNA polymerase sigma-70 factor (ECF subfamily)
VVVRPLNDPSLADAELVDRAKRGDVAAYEQLVERYQQPVYRAAYFVTRSAADAQEAAQDAFVKAHAALGRFRSGAPLRPWLLRSDGASCSARSRTSARTTGW